MIRVLSIILFFTFGSVLAQSGLDSHHYSFKGFSFALHDEITDADGHHILVGDVRILENYAKDRDARLDALYKLSDYAIEHGSKGLILVVDATYNIIKMEGLPSSLKRIVWDAQEQCYWTGGSTPSFHNKFWYQISLTQLNSKKEIVGITGIETEGNTYVQDMVLKDKNLVLLTMTMTGEIGETKYVPTVFEVNPTRLHDAQNYIWPKKVVDIMHQSKMDFPQHYRFDFSPLFVKDGSVYFALGNAIDQEYGTRFFRYKDGKSEYINTFANIDATHSPYLIGFLPTSENQLLTAYAFYFSQKLFIAKTDAFLQPVTEKQSKIAAYPDFNQLLQMPNGKIVLLTRSKKDYWSYLIFKKDGDFLTEIETSISEKMYPSLFKLGKGSTIISSFFRSGHPEPTVLQTLVVD